MDPESKSFFTRLRSAAQGAHQRAESLVGLPGSVRNHIQTLKIFYGFIEPWEASVAALLAPLESELRGRWKVGLLREDLKNLGVFDDAVASIPRCDRLSMLNSLPAALGSMYVFEGATLGGQILSRHVEQRLGLQNGIGYSYYLSYGSNVGMMWRQYCQLLVQLSLDAPDDVIASACATFNSLCDWFENQRGGLSSQESGS